mgnify:CR=1 FL=1
MVGMLGDLRNIDIMGLHFHIGSQITDLGVFAELCRKVNASYRWFTEEGFRITLNFGNSPEPLYIPFDALRTFVDPSVEFGLRFENHEDDEEDEEDEDEDSPDDPGEDGPKVVSLDQFRKK